MSANSRRFIDTNVVLYLLSGDATRADRSETLIAGGGVLSVQVLNEFVSVARRKLGLPWAEIRDVLAALKANLEIRGLTPHAQARAVDFAEKFALNIYDAAIVAAAIEAGCATLLTEDLQHGRVIEGVSIENPYL